MGTRSTTKIYEVYEDDNRKKHKELILSLYKQFDGYTAGWGKDLKEFIKSGKFVNGYSLASDERQFNGIGCFALQLVKEFKDGVGGLYATTKEDSQEYNYSIIYDVGNYDDRKATLTIECEENKKFKEVIEIKL